jgi:hypothetical protein
VALALFVIAMLVFVYVPGRFVLDGAKLAPAPLEHFALTLILGATVSSMLYWLAACIGLPHLFLIWPAIAVVGWLARSRPWRTLPRLHRPCVRHVVLLAAIALTLSPFVVLPSYYRNLAPTGDGDLTFSRLADAILHLAIANELTHTVPPEVPYAAGVRLSYHHGMDLLGALLSRFAGLDVGDLTVRFLPTLWMVATGLAIVCFARAWLGSAYAAIVLMLLVVLGEDFSFLPGLLLRPQAIWTATFFRVPTVPALYWLNPMLPGLGILFAGLLCVQRYCEELRRAWLVLAAFLLAVLASYKFFAAAHVGASLGLAALVLLLRHRDTRLLKVTALTGIAVLPIVLYTAALNQTGTRLSIRLEPYPYVGDFLRQLGLLTAAPGTGTLIVLAALPLYVVAALGLRTVGVPGVAVALARPSPRAPLRHCLAIFVVLGVVATLLLRVTPPSASSEYNNAVWFFVQAKYVVWLFAVERLLDAWRRHDRWIKAGLVAATIVLTAPSTVQYVRHEYYSGLDRLSPGLVAIAQSLAGRCSHGEVTFARQAIGEVVVARTRCRTPMLALFESSYVPPGERERRTADTAAFWSAIDSGLVRREILETYRATYLVLGTADRERAAGALPPPIAENRELALYQVSGARR